ncbi:MAG: N-acetylglucosamine-6-phosphate deacetylase [Candidatus Promineifilaceae bacterium]|nr:N-acetylglucosamine-6-phosphate deacetylase [Candidatus Promineifilaceae bacterium]
MDDETSEGILIRNARLFAPTGVVDPGWLLTAGEEIRALGPGRPPAFAPAQVGREVDADGRRLLPGFIDLHAHGAVGHEVMDADPEGIREIARFYARHGVTAFLPTTWTAARERLMAALAAVEQVIGPAPDGATVLGAYVEGPYLNPEKCGAQDTRYIRRADRTEAQAILDTGVVRVLALAPEFEENVWLIEECVRRGVTVSAAHTTAGFEAMGLAVERGLRQVTHMFNAMVGLGHRRPGTVGAAMAFPEINCELIADNVHVHPPVMKILVDVKGPEGVILITDAIRGAGMPDGEYAIDERTVTVRDGAARLPDGTLAGSILTMDRALHNVQAATGRPLEAVWPMASLNAARAIGVAGRRGSLEVGKAADLVLLDEAYNVALTVAEGRIVFCEIN